MNEDVVAVLETIASDSGISIGKFEGWSLCFVHAWVEVRGGAGAWVDGWSGKVGTACCCTTGGWDAGLTLLCLMVVVVLEAGVVFVLVAVVTDVFASM